MRLSCLPVSFFGAIRSGEMSIGQWAKLAVEIGFDAIDLSILFLENSRSDELADMRREIEASGTCVAVVNTYPDFTHPDPIERERELNRLAEHIRISADIGSEMVRITAGQAHPETGRSEGIKWVIDSFSQSAEVAEHAGIRLVYENHSKPGVWKYWDFSHHSDIFLEIADATKDMPIGILFDTANPITDGKDPVVILEKVIDRIEYVHAADTGEWGKLQPVVIGTGLVPFKEIFAALHNSGYDGVISLEEASGMGEAGVRSATQFVRDAWASGGR